MDGLTNWQKCRLLIWKNWLLKWNQKIALILEILLPIACFIMLNFVRMDSLSEIKETVYKEVEVNDIALFQKMAVDPFKLVLFYSPENIVLKKIIAATAKYLEIKKFQAYPNASELEKALEENNYFVGVQFDDDWHGLKIYPKNFSFALRFPSELRTSNTNLTWSTNQLFEHIKKKGPRNPSDADGGLPVGYLREGFLPMQYALSRSYIKLVANSTKLPSIKMKRYPYPKYVSDMSADKVALYSTCILVLSFIYSAASTVRNITAEKETQLKELMKIMGLSNCIHWTAWFINSFTIMGILICLIVILLKLEWSNHYPILIYARWSVLLVFLLVYITASICFCFMMATFFSKATTAAAVTCMMWIMTYMPFFMIYNDYTQLHLVIKLAGCLFSNTALALGMKLITEFEVTDEGIHWSNLFTPVNIDDDLTIGHIILTMLASCVLYMFICLYVEQIFPGEFGVSRKDYGLKEYPRVKELPKPVTKLKNPVAFEPELEGHAIGLQAKNMQKKFGDKIAVNGLSINMHDSEITVLLGHNGAGKTTTISMLTGMFPPTSGTAVILGSDIRTNRDIARREISICPQNNVLFDNLTVKQHLIFFSRLKGLKGMGIQQEVDKYIKLLELENMSNVNSKNLSAGMKRKLSVCCALTGNAKVVLLDEPSSGLDPSERQKLWDLLESEKPRRTMLLTTDAIDEAEVLGDRIAIMCNGELKCHGTSFFLKKKFGSGYRLICVKRDDCNSDEVTNLLQTYIPDLRLESEIGAELTYQLSDNYSSQFEEILESLENKLDELKLSSFGITITSMEEVFMKVGKENPQYGYGPISGSSDSDDAESIRSKSLTSGINLLANQWYAMLFKNFINSYRNKYLLLLQSVIPICFVCLVLTYQNLDSLRSVQPMTVGLTQYPYAVTLLETSSSADNINKGISKKYQQIAKSYGSNYEFRSTGNESILKHISDLGKTLQARIDTRYLAAATLSKSSITAWLNNQALHTAPLTVNLAQNAMLKSLMGNKYQITVTNAPVPYTKGTKLKRAMENNKAYVLSLMLCFSLCFVSCFYILFVIKERETRFKLLQLLGGVHICTFWLSQFLCDLISFAAICVMIIICIACFQEVGYSSFDELTPYLLILILFCCSALPFTYLVSFCFTNPSTGFIGLFMINIFGSVVLYLTLPLIEERDKNIAEHLNWFMRVFPHFLLIKVFNILSKNLSKSEICATDYIVGLSKDFKCKWAPKCCYNVSVLDWREPGVLTEIVMLSSSAVGFFSLIILLEYKLHKKLMNLIQKCIHLLVYFIKKPSIIYEDHDVAEEKRRIREMSSSDIKSTNLVLDRVTKYYKNFLAVNQVSFCVKPGECLGLLGPNGAGKTAVLKMMTGEETITIGKAYIKGTKMGFDMNKVHKGAGYCPQSDALCDDLTARETLEIFCLIKGIRWNRIKENTEELARSFGFITDLDKQIKDFNAGNKRKLNTAIAFIGSPSIIFLDEPTTGMDSFGRQQLRTMVYRLRDSGKSIILTSHIMEECEAMCNRLAIMVNGKFKCIGSTQHLKNKFSKSVVLKIKVKYIKDSMDMWKTFFRPRYRNQSRIFKLKTGLITSNNTSPSLSANTSTESFYNMNSNIRRVKNFVEIEFPQAELQEEYQSVLTYRIPLSVYKWSKMFGIMETYRTALNIDDYYISQMTLEEVFLQFAQKQKAEKRPRKT